MYWHCTAFFSFFSCMKKTFFDAGLSDSDKLQYIKDTLDEMYNKINSLKEEKKSFIKDVYTNDEIIKLKEEINRLKDDNKYGFSISSEEHLKIDEWKKSKEKIDTGAISGRYEYLFIPTSIGVIGKIIDPITNDEFTFRELS